MFVYLKIVKQALTSSSMKHKIDYLLDSCQAKNTLLAYYFIQDEMGIGRKVALHYIMDYYFEHNIGKQADQMCIGFGQQLEIVFKLIAEKSPVGNYTHALKVHILKNEQVICQDSYMLAETSSSDKINLNQYYKQDFDSILPRFYDQYIPYMLTSL